MAEATKLAFASLFAANEKAHTLGADELRGLVAQVAGTDEEVTKRTAGTFRTLVELSDFTAPEPRPVSDTPEIATGVIKNSEVPPPPMQAPPPMRPEFHYNIQIHLPSNASEETYLSIFNAIRRSFA